LFDRANYQIVWIARSARWLTGDFDGIKIALHVSAAGFVRADIEEVDTHEE
jgi:hypothetical protein